jgi:DNA-binding response OmpR family regulator
MPALILLANADSKVLQQTEAVLSEAGHLVAAAPSFDEARHLLESVSPDLLITDVRLKAFNGLHLVIRSRVDHPMMPVIVTHPRPDAIFEAEAERHGALFMPAPLENPRVLPAVRAALDLHRQRQILIRRWHRKPVSGIVELEAATVPAQIVDLSYGGLRLSFGARREIPDVFEITLPEAGLRVKARRVWTSHSRADDTFWCGAEVTAPAAGQWRAFVDSMD